MENEKENESFISNNADEAGSSSTVQPKAQKISVQSQLLNL